jgi:hypothetical protein
VALHHSGRKPGTEAGLICSGGRALANVFRGKRATHCEHATFGRPDPQVQCRVRRSSGVYAAGIHARCKRSSPHCHCRLAGLKQHLMDRFCCAVGWSDPRCSQTNPSATDRSRGRTVRSPWRQDSPPPLKTENRSTWADSTMQSAAPCLQCRDAGRQCRRDGNHHRASLAADLPGRNGFRQVSSSCLSTGNQCVTLQWNTKALHLAWMGNWLSTLNGLAAAPKNRSETRPRGSVPFQTWQ